MSNIASILLFICSVQFLFIIFLLLSNTDIKELVVDQAKETKTQLENLENITFSSQVFCYGEERENRQCHFQNLCYNKNKNEFLFYHGRNTKMYGIPEYVFDHLEALLDLSSVANHDALYFHLRSIRNKIPVGAWFYSKPSILMKRFNPDNLMHVIHDDLLPLYHTQRRYFPLEPNISFIFMENRNKGPYFELYRLFSDTIIMLNELPEMTCFKDVLVGVSKATTWYQYGFHTPQGPINKTKYPYKEIEYFRDQVMTSYKVLQSNESEEYIIYVSRTVTRRILNEAQLIFNLMSHFRISVKTISLENDDLSEIILSVSNAKILVGVHGAHLSLAAFMKQETLVVEIFPFAIPAQDYMPYKTLCNIKRIRYVAWENVFENNTVTHEDWPPDLGGINQLSAEQQNQIKSQKVIGKHLCCHNPFWLFRIYQDTIVNITDFLTLLKTGVPP